jgi:hypothetical protein
MILVKGHYLLTVTRSAFPIDNQHTLCRPALNGAMRNPTGKIRRLNAGNLAHALN